MQPLLESLPTFDVFGKRSDDRGIVLFGCVSSTEFGRQTWIADRYLGYLKHGDFLARGRWHAGGENWEFALDESQTAEELPDVNEFQILDGYWGERAELVLDRKIVWQPERWQVQDDHDHCAICWATICSTENQAHFIATTGERVCAACYQAYVSTRALSFIAVAA
jgi:hypothetical protein